MTSNETRQDSFFMLRAIDLARRASWRDVSDNPRVGAVLVHEDRVIGEGYHHASGAPHAEVMCISSVKDEDKALIASSTLYVTLEPCCHTGKTPPCTSLILAQRIPKVVIGVEDPFEQVSGCGIKILKENGIKVKVGIEKRHCLQLAHRFFANQWHKRPLITLKWAQSQDGFIDHLRADHHEAPAYRFSSAYSSTWVHKVRAEHDAILVGGETFRKDHPRLDLRLWQGREPMKLVLSRQKDLEKAFQKKSQPGLWRRIELDRDEDLFACLHRLYVKEHLHSILVEGGRHVHELFLGNDLWDCISYETAPVSLIKGVPAPQIETNFLRKNTDICYEEKDLSGNTIHFFERLR